MSDSNPPDHDPFAEFEDWLVDGPAGEWPLPWEGRELSETQKQIVARNVELLTYPDPACWNNKVDRFEAALTRLLDQRAISTKRAEYIIRFDRFSFDDGLKDFSRRRFPCLTSFAGTKFGDGDVCFDHTWFGFGGVDFYRAWFGNGVIGFNCATFDVVASFASVTFGDGGVSFSQSKFSGYGVSFDDAEFGDGTIDFYFTNFGDGTVSFVSTRFVNADIHFFGSIFGKGSLILRETNFGIGGVNLNRVTFGDGDVVVRDSNIKMGKLSLGNLELAGRLDCSGLSVQEASFRNTQVTGLADFTGTQFGTIPDFCQTRLERSPEVARMVMPAPVQSRTRSETDQETCSGIERLSLFSLAIDADDVLKLRKLKAMAIAANDHEKDGEFFAYEMMAKRGTEHTTFWQLLFNTIYWQVSFYGQSYLRPLAWLGASFGTFAAIYSLMAALPIGGWQSLAFGATFSFKNSLPFLGTLTRSVPSPEGHVSWFALQLQAIKDAQPGPDWFTVLGTGQAMLSLFFFFFLLLGLRNKFRLK